MHKGSISRLASGCRGRWLSCVVLSLGYFIIEAYSLRLLIKHLLELHCLWQDDVSEDIQ